MKVTVKLNPKTPKKVNSNIRAVLTELGLSSANPVYLPYTHRASEYRARYCFNNCEIEAAKTGCEIVYGWMLWEDRKRSFVEAEFHSIIKENGQFLDITPRPQGEQKILFVPDRFRASGRKEQDTWHSWSNPKMVNGKVTEAARQLEVREVSEEFSEVTYI